MTGIKLVDEAIEKAKTSTKTAEELLAEKLILGHYVDPDDELKMRQEREQEIREKRLNDEYWQQKERMAGYAE